MLARDDVSVFSSCFGWSVGSLFKASAALLNGWCKDCSSWGHSWVLCVCCCVPRPLTALSPMRTRQCSWMSAGELKRCIKWLFGGNKPHLKLCRCPTLLFFIFKTSVFQATVTTVYARVPLWLWGSKPWWQWCVHSCVQTHRVPRTFIPQHIHQRAGRHFCTEQQNYYIYTSPVGGSIADDCTTTIAAYKTDRHLQQASERRWLWFPVDGVRKSELGKRQAVDARPRSPKHKTYIHTYMTSTCLGPC